MMGKKMCPLHMVAWILVLVGALNWGLVGLFEWNLVDAILGSWPLVVRIVYILVGLSALLMLFKHKCKACMGGKMEKKMGGGPKPGGGM